MNITALDPAILIPAFLAGVLVLSTHVPLGREVLARGIIFIDLAVAQVAATGVIAARMFAEDLGAVGVQAAAFGAALLAAMVLRFTERYWREIQEALIGSLFVLAASVAVLLLAGNPRGGEHLRDLLVGQILWVSPTALSLTAAVSACVLIYWFGLRRRQQRGDFYLLFAVSVTSAVQLVGIYLVFASLILPALATRRFGAGRGLAWGYGLGVAGYALGIGLSAVTDLPTGPLVVVTLAVAATAITLLTRGQKTPA